MSTKEGKAAVSRVLASIYGSMIILAGILLFLTATGLATTTLLSSTDHQVRAFILFWLVSWMLAVTGVELARDLYKSGMNIVSFLLFLVVNFVLVLMIQVVFADTLNTDAAGTAVGMVVIYLIGAAIYNLLIVLLMLRDWRAKRQ